MIRFGETNWKVFRESEFFWTRFFFSKTSCFFFNGKPFLEEKTEFLSSFFDMYLRVEKSCVDDFERSYPFWNDFVIFFKIIPSLFNLIFKKFFGFSNDERSFLEVSFNGNFVDFFPFSLFLFKGDKLIWKIFSNFRKWKFLSKWEFWFLFVKKSEYFFWIKMDLLDFFKALSNVGNCILNCVEFSKTEKFFLFSPEFSKNQNFCEKSGKLAESFSIWTVKACGFLSFSKKKVVLKKFNEEIWKTYCVFAFFKTFSHNSSL